MSVRIVNSMLVILSFIFATYLSGDNLLRLEKTIDNSYFGQEMLFSNEIRDIYVDREKNLIFVVDSKFCQIKVFTKDGRLQKVFGRRGQGPGEFLKPESLCETADNRFYVIADSDGRRLQFFKKDFSFEKLLKTPRIRVADMISIKDDGFWVVPNKGFFIHISMEAPKNKKSQPVLYKISSEGQILEKVGSSPYKKNFYLNEMMKNVVLLAGPNGTLITCYTIRNKIEIFNGSKVVRKFTIPLKFKPVQPKASMKHKGDTFFMELSMDKILNDATLDKEGKLYLVLYDSNTSAKTKTSSVGQYLCKFDLRNGKILGEWPIKNDGFIQSIDFLGDGSIVMLENQDEDFSVHIYTILSKGEHR